MFVDEIFSGPNYSNFPKISVIENKMNTKEMVKVKGINMISTCEHHFVTIDGMASVAYILNDKIIGLSKINRLVSIFLSKAPSSRKTDRANKSVTSNTSKH